MTTADEHEPAWQRDKRLRDEEARMVQLESNVAAIKIQTEAIRGLFEDERRARRRSDELLSEHELSDNNKFASIDSRLQGFQTQMSTVLDALKRIESKGDGVEPRLRELEEERLGRSAVGRFLASAWVQLGIGVGIGGSLVGVYALFA